MSETTTPLNTHTGLFNAYSADPSLGADLQQAILNAIGDITTLQGLTTTTVAAVNAAAAAAATSQGAAAGSATSANTNAVAAAASAAAASTSASGASSSATAAATSATNAASSASAASGSATTASGAATTATTQAGNAATSSSAAATSATNAAASATAAAASAGSQVPSNATPLVDSGTGSAGVSSNYSRGDHYHPTDTSRAALASPAFTGTPTAPTATVNDNSTKLATTAYAQAQAAAQITAAALAPLASPALTGNPTAPTQAVSDSSTKLANTAFVIGQAATVAPLIDATTAVVGTSTLFARQDHVHPTDTSRAALASPALTGTPTAPTAAVGTSTTQLATTAFVLSEFAAPPALGSTTPAAVSATSLNGSSLGGFRNRVINGNFSINQRAYVSGTALTAGAYGHDRWKAGASGCTYTFTAASPDTTITITAGSLQQVIEGVNLEGGSMTLAWSGTAQARYNGGAYGASPLAITATAGTNLTIEFNAGTVGQVRQEAGTVAGPYERRFYSVELQMCQRYFLSLGAVIFLGYAGAGTAVEGIFCFPVTMRAAPTVVGTGPTYTNASTLAVGYVLPGSVGLTIGATATGTAQCQLTGLTASAEL